MKIEISQKILDKLAERNICAKDIHQCFENISGGFLEDPREEHKTDPMTEWFVSETNRQRKLKIMFVLREKCFHIKSAYDATEEIIRIYEKYGI